MTTLYIKSGPRAGEKVEVTGDLVIGREGADLTIDDGELSRRHAVVRSVADGLEVEDLGSKNGTFVDGRLIDGPALVAEGAQLKLGATVLEVRLVSEATRLSPVDPSVGVPGTPADATRPRASPGVQAPLPAPGSPAAAVAGVGVASPAGPSGVPVGEFRPPGQRPRGLATRSWVPVVLSFGTAIVTAIALVVYFATR